MNCEDSRDIASPEEVDPKNRAGIQSAGSGPEIAARHSPRRFRYAEEHGAIPPMNRPRATTTTLRLVAAGTALLLAVSPACARDDSPKNPWDLRLFRFEFDNDSFV